MKLERIYNHIEDRHCQNTNCLNKVEFEVGFILIKEEYYILLCPRCKEWFKTDIGGNHAPDEIGGESSAERGQARAESEGGESAEL